MLLSVWILTITLAAISAESNTKCRIIAFNVNQRKLAKCPSLPTADDWKIIGGNRTERLELEKIQGGYLMGPETKLLHVQEITLRNIKLEAIEEGFFSSLGFELNSIIMDQVQLTKPLTMRHFRGLEDQLDSLKISKSFLKIDTDALTGMRKLKTLYLKHMPVREAPTNFDALLRSGLKHIDLSGTQIQVLPWNAIIPWSIGDVGASGIFSFEDAHLHCDETTIQFRNRLNENEEKAKFNGFRCASPEQFKGKLLKDITVEELQSVTVTPPVMPEATSENDFFTDNTERPVELETTAKASYSLVAMAVLGGIVVFIVIIITAALLIKYAQNKNFKNHTPVRKTVETGGEDPTKQAMLSNYNNNNNNHKNTINA